MKKPNRQQQRQRQKPSRKTIILICAATISCMVIGLTVFFHMSDVKQTNAASSHMIIVSDQEFTTEKSIPEPVLVQRSQAQPNTIFARKAKMIQQPSTSASH